MVAIGVSVALFGCGDKGGPVDPVDQSDVIGVAKAALDAIAVENSNQLKSLTLSGVAVTAKEMGRLHRRYEKAETVFVQPRYIVCALDDRQLYDAFAGRHVGEPDRAELVVWLRQRDDEWWFVDAKELQLEDLRYSAATLDEAKKRAGGGECARDPKVAPEDQLDGWALYKRAKRLRKKLREAAPVDDIMRLLTKSCGMGHRAGCVELGREYCRAGESDRCVEVLDDVCGAGKYQGCNLVGRIYENGKHGVGKDTAKAREYYAKACEIGNRPRCGRLERMDAEAE
jgi:hypothetical protein